MTDIVLQARTEFTRRISEVLILPGQVVRPAHETRTLGAISLDLNLPGPFVVAGWSAALGDFPALVPLRA